MKKLIASVLLVLSVNATMARTPIDPSNPGFQPCTSGDISLLEAASVRGSRGIINLIREHILPEKVTCVVEKPRFFHPAVCGAAISQVDTFKITTEDGGAFDIVVDSSYQSCLRIRVIPMVKSLEFRPIEPTFFP